MYKSDFVIDTHAHFFDNENLIETRKILKDSARAHNISFTLVSFAVSERTEDGKAKHSFRSSLNFLLKMCKTYNDFGMLIWIKPRKSQSTIQLEKFIIKNRKYIYGLKIHPYYSQIKMDDKRIIPFIKLAEKLDLPILVHTATDEYSRVKILAKVAKKYKKVKFIAAHLELETSHEEALNYIKDIPNLYGDTAWVSIKTIVRAKELKILDKIMFGTDNPIDGINTLDNDIYSKYYENMIHLNKENISKIMYKNAMNIYKISEEKLK